MPAVSDLTLDSLANALVRSHGLARVASLNTVSTGIATVPNLDLEQIEVYTSLKYVVADHAGQQRWAPTATLDDVRRHIDRHRLGRSFDLAIVDPHHTYADSVEGLTVGFGLVRPGGLVLVHDCLPPSDMTSKSYVEGGWSGVTFAAMHDFCEAHGLQWCTVDADLGLGVISVPSDKAFDVEATVIVLPDDEQIESRRRRHACDAFAGMRVVQALDGVEACSRLLSGQGIDDLIVPSGTPQPVDFERWSRGVGDWLATQSERDAAVALLAESQRRLTLLEASPKAQLRALVRSLPASLRRRLLGRR